METQGQNAVAAKMYNPFGAVLEQYGTTQTTYGYTGEQFNATSGLLYLRARYYNSNLRLFSAKDPFAGSPTAPASMHGYSYAHNNPILYTDPTGLFISEWVQGNQDLIVKAGITVVAIGGTATICATTALVGCIIGAGVIAASSSYSYQATDNIWKASNNSNLFSLSAYNRQTLFNDIDWYRVGLDGIIGSAGAVIGYGTGSLVHKTFFATCKSGLCSYGATVSSGFITGSSVQMLYNSLDNDPCTGLFDNVISSGLKGMAFATVAFGAQKGAELAWGNNFRIAPFGNRTGHPEGTYPHYHYRSVDPVTGKTLPGQSISRHRPWELKNTDTSFWDRFR